MPSIMKVFLLLAAMVCISIAQTSSVGQQCLCQGTRNSLSRGMVVKDIQIYPATIFCNKVEIVVTNMNGLRFCLNPEIKAVQKLVAKIMGKQKATARPTQPAASTPNTSASESR
ncbi:C-X-C motif chemokine 11-1-like isoform 2-T2 [Pholidichthys leucotaenia]